MSMSWYYFHLVHLILNAKNLMWKTSGNAFLRAWRMVSFSYFPKVALDYEVGGAPNTF